MSTQTLRAVRLSLISPDPRNPRTDLGDLTELAASIAARGVRQPITVRPHTHAAGRFVIIDGHRRHAAARLAGLEAVRVIVQHDTGPDSVLEDQLIANLHRADMTPADKARAFGRLRERYSLESIARRTGFSVATIRRYLALLELDGETLARVESRDLPLGQAEAAVNQARRNGYRPGTSRDLQEPARRKVRLERPWFGPKHPLAEAAKLRCDLAGHDSRPKVGGACGQDWEHVIREDERSRAAAGGAR